MSSKMILGWVIGLVVALVVANLLPECITNNGIIPFCIGFIFCTIGLVLGGLI